MTKTQNLTNTEISEHTDEIQSIYRMMTAEEIMNRDPVEDLDLVVAILAHLDNRQLAQIIGSLCWEDVVTEINPE